MNKAIPKLSIIIPVYNTEKYLSECLDSILNQSFQDFEVICVDDCSTDNSFALLKDYENSDERIKVLQNDVNLGAGLSRNKGFDVAQGEYILFFDSDDWLLEDSLTIIYDRAKNNNLDILILNYNYYDNIKKKYLASQNLPKNKSIYNVVTDYKCDEEVFLIWCSNRCYKREFLLENNLYFNNWKNFEDVVFYIQALKKASRIMVLADILFIFRISRTDSIEFEYDKNPQKLAGATLDFYNWLEANSDFDNIVLLKNTLLRSYIFHMIIIPRKKNYFWNKNVYNFTKEQLSKVNLKIFKEYYKDGEKLIRTFLEDSYFYYNIKTLFLNLFPTFFDMLLKLKSKVKQ